MEAGVAVKDELGNCSFTAGAEAVVEAVRAEHVGADAADGDALALDAIAPTGAAEGVDPVVAMTSGVGAAAADGAGAAAGDAGAVVEGAGDCFADACA